MPHYDMPLEKLKTYLPKRDEPNDFDGFWKKTINEVKAHSIDVIRDEIKTPFLTVKVYDISFSGYDGQTVKGWLIIPKNHRDKLPCIIEHVGYGGGRGYPVDHLVYASAGFAHFVMDTRGQGSMWRRGDTPDIFLPVEKRFYPGFTTRGIFSPNLYYYRRLIVDSYRAVDAVIQMPEVESEKVFVSGFSQGGGLSIAVAGLRDDILGCSPDFPFLCHTRRATQMVVTSPYLELIEYCKLYPEQVDTIFYTLSYFDGMNFAVRARCEGLFSVGLMDDVCPPSTVYAAYNHFNGPKHIVVYEYNQHDAGGSPQVMEKIQFFDRLAKSN